MTTRSFALRLVLPALVATSACAPEIRKEDVPDTEPRTPMGVQGDTGTITRQGDRVQIECPNISAVDAAGRDSEAVHDTTVDVPVAGAIRDIPEYHDCQRLVTQNRQYGPLVGIFARESLEAISEEQFIQPGGVVVGQIYNFSSIPYGPLNIRPRYSCLYLRLDRESNNWRARLIPRDSAPDCPPLQSSDWSAAGPLTVRQLKPSADSTHYPAVARWDRDPDARVHYIGIKCLTGWCEIGIGAFASSRVHSHPDVTGQIKGWYDEQRLAEPNHEGPGFRPVVRARIVPVPRLDSLTSTHYTCNFPCARSDGWIHVATTYMEDNSAYYHRKLNFRPGGTGNRIFLRRVLNNGRERWQSRIISAAGDTMYRRTLRVDHTPPATATMGTRHPIPPATARWHWREDDETTWNRCDLGCCETTRQEIDPDVW